MAAADWDGAAYHRVSNPQFQWGLQVLQHLALRGDETVLDAGCGTGRVTEKLLERLPRGKVIALDVSPSMLEVAKAYLSPRFGERVLFLQSDLQALSLPQQVDAAFSTATFHWVKDHPRLFAGLHAAIRPGGWLVAQCGGEGNLQRLHARAERLSATEPFAPYFRNWVEPWNFASAATTARRLGEAGFVEVETRLAPTPTRFANADEYRQFVAPPPLRNHLAPLPEDLWRRFLHSVVEQAAGDDPPFTLDYCRLNLSGRRASAS